MVHRQRFYDLSASRASVDKLSHPSPCETLHLIRTEHEHDVFFLTRSRGDTEAQNRQDTAETMGFLNQGSKRIEADVK